MRYDQARSAGAVRAAAYVPIEYPKYVDVDGKPTLALNSEHEAELLGISSSEESEGNPALSQNLLSAPEKRGPGRPRIIRDAE